MRNRFFKFQTFAKTASVTAALLLSACFNGNVNSTYKAAKAISTNTQSQATGPSYTIISATVAATTGANPQTLTTLQFDASNQNTVLTSVCAVTGTSGNDPRACLCRYAWDETNQASSNVINRSVDTSPTQISNFQVQCPVPTIWTNEIPNGTVMSISVVPDASKGNNTNFTTNEISYTKSATNQSGGDFHDIEGRSYKNIYHYVCFDKFQKALSISRYFEQNVTQTSGGQPVGGYTANKFVTGSSSNSTYSAQSYYYDFYVRSNELGSIAAGDSTFTCPMVNTNGVPSFFPLDSTFATALYPSTKWNIPVTVAAPRGNGSIQGTIIGYAMQPDADGTCSPIVDSNGQIRRTFRLRQYASVYPLRFEATGEPLPGSAQALNIIYVLDRPVNKASQNSNKPITRLGPKPCPFAYKTAQFGYKCMTDATLNGYNIDGTQINGDPECPIYPPPPASLSAYKSDGTLVIRPYKPFVPNFIENTSYKACAFQSSTPVDPEIVLSYDNGVFSSAVGPHNFWCSKSYPKAGDIIPPPNGDPFDKAPSECDLTSAAAAIKTNKGYACLKTYDPFNGSVTTPQAGCCQICSGTNCTAQGGGTNAAGRNAVFSPPQNTGNPNVASKTLPRATPNVSTTGCYDPSEP